MENTSPTQKLSVPAAIIVGAFIIALAIVAVKIGKPAPSANTNTTNAPAKTIVEQVLASKNQAKPAEVATTDHIRGATNPKITIVEYSDTECPFCKSFQTTLQAELVAHPSDIAWVYRHFPLDSIHPKTRKEAEATECAAEQGGDAMFWSYIDKVFATTTSNNTLDPAKLPIIAGDLGLDVTAFNTCLSSGKYAARVESQYQDGVKIGVQGTPESVLVMQDGTTYAIPGAIPKASMDELLAKLLK